MEKSKSEDVMKMVTVGGFILAALSALCSVFTNGFKAYNEGKELKASKEG